jgi:hypothetical protein
MNSVVRRWRRRVYFAKFSWVVAAAADVEAKRTAPESKNPAPYRIPSR